MVLNPVAQMPVPPERRAAGRARTDCPVRLQSPLGNWHGRMVDLSETGARIEVANPPTQGVLVLISWHSHEMFCRIVWSADDMCGVVFERPIPRSAVQATLGEQVDVDTAPPASVGNIPIGQRRGRLRSAES